MNYKIREKLRELFYSLNQETQTHCINVGNLSEALAIKSGTEASEIIKIAGYLHDIGKLYVPKNILEKNGKLTKEEFEIIKQHTVKGYDILIDLLEEYEYRWFMATSARWHHERKDGNGYPDKIKEIPFYVQIISIADVYDALTSKRCYKEAISKEEALKMIEEGKSGVFDEKIIELLKAVVNGGSYGKDNLS